jgi:CHAT domain-containing protein
MSTPAAADLIRAADAAHAGGDFDAEITFRWKAFSDFVGPGPAPVAQLELAAHRVLDIGDRLKDPSSEAEWQEQFRYGDLRHGFWERAVLELVKAGEPERAFALTQRVKSPHLVRRLRQHTAERDDLSPVAARYRDAFARRADVRNRIRQARRDEEDVTRLVEEETLLDIALKTHETTLRQEDPEALASFGAPLVPNDLLPMLPPDGGTALIEFFMTNEACIGLMARRDGDGVQMKAAVFGALGRKLLLEQAREWFTAVMERDIDRMDSYFPHLASFLHDRLMCGLADLLRSHGHWHAILVPHSLLNGMPLHATPICDADHSDGTVWFADQFVVTHVPCVQMALTSALRPRPTDLINGDLPAFLFADPAGDLPAATVEQEAIQRHLAENPWPTSPVEATRVNGNAIEPDEAVRSMSESGLAVLAAHAKFNPGDPYGSGIYLTSEEGSGIWTIDEIYASPHFDRNPVVALSSCESGLTWLNDSSDAIALPPALIALGSAAVLATLWIVEDVSASLLVERFVYHLLDPGETPGTALAEASKELRHVGREEALDRCDAILSDLENRGIQFGSAQDAYYRLQTLRHRIAGGPDLPFASPIFWGGFAVTGCGWWTHDGPGELTRTPQLAVGMIEAIQTLQLAGEAFNAGDYEEAERLAGEASATLDGQWLGRALLVRGDARCRREWYDDETLTYLRSASNLLAAHGETDWAQHADRLIGMVTASQRSRRG